MSLNTIFFEGLQITSQAEYFLFVEHIEIRLCSGGVQREKRDHLFGTYHGFLHHY